MGFSPETRRQQKEKQGGRCAILGLEVDKLEGHHAILSKDGGSNNPKNCIMLAGYDAYCAYGLPVTDEHEVADQKGIKERLYLHPDTLEYVKREQMPKECFRDESMAEMPGVRKKKKKKKHKK